MNEDPYKVGQMLMQQRAMQICDDLLDDVLAAATVTVLSYQEVLQLAKKRIRKLEILEKR